MRIRQRYQWSWAVFLTVLGCLGVVSPCYCQPIVTDPEIVIDHGAAINSLVFSSDAERLLTGGDDGIARLWNTTTGLEIAQFDHGTAVYSVDLSSDDTAAVLGGADRRASVWNLSTEERLETLVGHLGEIRSVAFSPDGARVLTGSADRKTYLWTVEDGALIGVFTGHSHIVTGAVFSPDGEYVATASYDGTAALWETETSALLNRFRGFGGAVLSVAFAPNNRWLLTGQDDGLAKLWSVSETGEIGTYAGHSGSVNAVCFSPDGGQLVTGSKDGTARLWDVGTETTVMTFFDGNTSVLSVDYSSDGEWIATAGAGGKARIWNARAEPDATPTPVPTPTPTEPNINTVDNFPDPAFRAAVEAFMNVAPEGRFTASEAAARAGVLDCSNQDVATVQGAEFFTGLDGLDCSNNRIQDLTPIIGNEGFAAGALVDVRDNLLDCGDWEDVTLLSERIGAAEFGAEGRLITGFAYSPQKNFDPYNCEQEGLLVTGAGFNARHVYTLQRFIGGGCTAVTGRNGDLLVIERSEDGTYLLTWYYGQNREEIARSTSEAVLTTVFPWGQDTLLVIVEFPDTSNREAQAYKLTGPFEPTAVSGFASY